MTRRPIGRGPRRVLINLAISVDGKIDSAAREGGGFSSRLDRDRVDAVRSEADALIVGARTVRSENPPLFLRDPARRAVRRAAGRDEHLIVVIVSGSGRIPADARFLTDPARERWLAVPASLPDAALEPLAEPIASGALRVVRAGETAVEPQALLEALALAGAQTVLIEGGGETIAAFFEADLVDEVRVTLCPAILGGREAPGAVGGTGFSIAGRRRLVLEELQRVGDELFLRYSVGG